MIQVIFGFVLIAVGLTALALQRFYSSVPAKELKRLAARGDHLAAKLYRPVAYGSSLRLLLWTIVAASLGGGFVLLMFGLAWWGAFLAIVMALVAGFVWLPSLRLTVGTARVAVLFSSSLAWILSYTHTVLDAVGGTLNKFREVGVHTELYEKEDLGALLIQQKEQVDNRIALQELDLVQRTLDFGDKKAGDIVQSRKALKMLSVDESIGPILLDELHESGQSSFLVYEGEKENIVGTLFIRDAVAAKQGGKVGDLMRGDICYVNETFPLKQVLDAFTQTKHYLAVVVNDFEEFLGVITLDHLLNQLVGEIKSDFEAYEDKEAVAAYKPLAMEEVVEPQPTVATEQEDSSSEATEVVE